MKLICNRLKIDIFQLQIPFSSSSFYGGVPDDAGYALRCPMALHFFRSWISRRSKFQQTHVGRHSVLPGVPRPADGRLPLHRQPSICLHIIDSVLPFHMSMPPHSAYFHHIPSNLKYKDSQTCQLPFNTR